MTPQLHSLLIHTSLRRNLAIVVLLTCGSAASAAVQRDDLGVTLSTPTGATHVEFWADDIARVLHGEEAIFVQRHSWVVISEPARTEWQYNESNDQLQLSTPKLTLTINKQNGAVSVNTAQHQPLLSEATPGFAIEPTTIAGHQTARITQHFSLAKDEALYGLGQHQQGVMNWVGHQAHLQQKNGEVGIPVLLSSKGYLLLWDNPAVTDLDLGATKSNVVTWTSEAGQCVDYYVMGGESPRHAIAAYRRLTGVAPMFGKWVWGFWQCKERYQSQDELLGILAEYRRRQIPIDGVIQDWQYWKPGQWGSHEFDAQRFPDPSGMAQTIHKQNAHVLISVWARFDVDTEHCKALEAIGGLYPPIYPNVWPKGKGKWLDAFNPEARRLYWQQLSDELFKKNFDGWWLDATEAELGGEWGQMRVLDTAGGPGCEVYNAYPLLHTTGVYAGQRRESTDKRVFILTRSAFAGQQRNAAMTWSGDIHGNWETLARQIPAGVNFTACGIPYWNTDIGGFFGGNPEDPKYRELFIRWFQFSVFCPMMRVHGTGAGKELWKFNDSAQAILTDYIHLRYRLLPYIYSVAWNVTHHGDSMMRPLILDFPNDRAVDSIPDQYMFGPQIMVCPVIHPGTLNRSIYLPGQADWYDFWTGQRFPAGKTIEAKTPLNRIPLYVRAGSILPIGPTVQYAMEKTDPIELRVYRGADDNFTLYDDTGEGYGYEQGQYAEIPITWNESRQTLTIGQRNGTYPGIPTHRTFHIVWVDHNHGAGLPHTRDVDRTITYDGSTVTLQVEQQP